MEDQNGRSRKYARLDGIMYLKTNKLRLHQVPFGIMDINGISVEIRRVQRITGFDYYVYAQLRGISKMPIYDSSDVIYKKLDWIGVGPSKVSDDAIDKERFKVSFDKMTAIIIDWKNQLMGK